MPTRLETPKNALLGATVALLLGAWSVSALASNGFDAHCAEATNELPAPEIPTPSLNIEVAEHGMTQAASDMHAPEAASRSESSVLPALADVPTKSSNDAAEEQSGADESANTAIEPSGTAIQLPGVSEADLPRFRRQMYRTDI